MMKKLLIVGLLLLFVPLVFADDLFVNVSTSNDLDSNIFLSSGGSISNTLYCNAGVCTTSVYGGSVFPPEGQSFVYNSFNQEYVTRSGGGGLSLNGLTDSLGRVAFDYSIGNYSRFGGYPAWDLWYLLDAMFVSHMEYQSTVNNLEFLARKVDRLEAKMNIIEQITGLENNTYYQKLVDDEENRLFAIRTGSYKCFDDGSCLIVRTVR